ncbi:MAG: lysine 2,3-aminomutase [Calditrichaceae bacterium]|nr:lysine 2,3-aminomutase [Calditrichaceae bacterium]MBN2708509.1 lysine 2,3-aminomutase [Calditrichaceae bacterium]RQV96028.1 MAG: lysine 2,3-aminomutase [Calditrichota bacterium]
MFFSFKKFSNSKYAKYLPKRDLDNLKYLTGIFPFKVSEYVLDELIDWQNYKNDPIYRLTFPTKKMLSLKNWKLLKEANTEKDKRFVVRQIRRTLNPHPDGQKDNIPKIGNRTFEGIQHKYRETVLFFPAHGQTCHSYCTYCFRWAQFVNLDDYKFKSNDYQVLFDYLVCNRQVTDILFTGGDPMWMNNERLFKYLDIIAMPELNHVKNIRIGTKSLAFFPERYLGEQGTELLQKFESLKKQGKNITIMAHFSHFKELGTKKVQQAVQRILNAGVMIRTQAPLIRGINDSPDVWREMWKKSVFMGMVPYYMFVERDTGAHEYFSVPLSDAYNIFTEAYSRVTGLAKTVRGPSMSAWPGKVMVDGIIGSGVNKKFVLKFIQCRNSDLINKPFYAKYDNQATWLDELEIEPEMNRFLIEMAENSDLEDDCMNDVA